MGGVRARLGLGSGGHQALIAMALLMGGDYFIRGAERIGPKQVRRAFGSPTGLHRFIAARSNAKMLSGRCCACKAAAAPPGAGMPLMGSRPVMQRSREGRARAGAERHRLLQKPAAHSLALLPLLISRDCTSCSEHRRQGVPVCCGKEAALLVEYWCCSCSWCKDWEGRCSV